MREIKFRAWDKERKKMYHNKDYWFPWAENSPEPTSANCYPIIVTSAGILFCRKLKENCEINIEIKGKKYQAYTNWEEDALSMHNLVLMEQVGLTDKNGKEIYEGDILKHNPDDDDWDDSVVWWPEKSRFENKSFVDAFNIMSKRKGFEMYQLEGTMCELADWVQGSSNPSEIIGTIHDNGETK